MCRNYNLKQRLVTCILLLSLCLQSCTNLSNLSIPKTQKPTASILKPINQFAVKHLVDKELTAEGGHLVVFHEQSGQLRADVVINDPKNFSKAYRGLPVHIGEGIDLATIGQLDKKSQEIFVELKSAENNQPSYVYIGKRGHLEGMRRTIINKGDEGSERGKMKIQPSNKKDSHRQSPMNDNQNQEERLASLAQQMGDLKSQISLVLNALKIYNSLKSQLDATQLLAFDSLLESNSGDSDRYAILRDALLNLTSNQEFMALLMEGKKINKTIENILSLLKASRTNNEPLQIEGFSFPSQWQQITKNVSVRPQIIPPAPAPIAYNLTNFPDEILLSITCFLEARNLVALASTCKSLMRLIQDEQVLLARLIPAEHKLESIMYFAEPDKEIKRIYGSYLRAAVLVPGSFFNPSYFHLKSIITSNPRAKSLSFSRKELNLVPREISQLQRLNSLSLNNNNLTWLPPEIGSLPHRIPPQQSGKHDMGRFFSSPSLSYLQYLDLSNNRLIELPEEITCLSGLRRLNVSHNKLSQLPEKIRELNDLQEINVSHNNLTKLPNSLSGLPKLEILNIGYNKLSRCKIYYIFTNSELPLRCTINAEHNRFAYGDGTEKQDLVADRIFGMGKDSFFIGSLNYSHNQITILEPILINARNINLSHNLISKVNFSYLTQWHLSRFLREEGKEIAHLDLSYNKITEIIGKEEDYSEEDIPIQTLDLSHNQLRRIPDTGKWDKLSWLSVQDNQLKAVSSIDGLWRMPQLTYLDLSHNALSNIRHLSVGPSILRTLNLSATYLTQFPEYIYRLVALTTLNLSHNKLFQIPDGLRALQNLTRLVIDNNQFTAIPTAIIYLTKLSELDVSHNKIDTVPQAIIRLTNLSSLNLSHNQIAKFPQEMLYLTNMQHLDLSHNQMRTLPLQLSGLTKLKVLNINHNPITRVPDALAQLGILQMDDLVK